MHFSKEHQPLLVLDIQTALVQIHWYFIITLYSLAVSLFYNINFWIFCHYNDQLVISILKQMLQRFWVCLSCFLPGAVMNKSSLPFNRWVRVFVFVCLFAAFSAPTGRGKWWFWRKSGSVVIFFSCSRTQGPSFGCFSRYVFCKPVVRYLCDIRYASEKLQGQS